ncbi:MAG: dGTP triphosphohydrolase [Verrucomicrobiales bacterium]
MGEAPKNRFYTPNAHQSWDGPRKAAQDGRTPFEVDRDRIIYTPAFRRLQAKTQVFMAGEFDFYRTRLTHSIEVAQVGRSICEYLRRTSPFLSEDFFIDPHLVEAICLAHDLGHPPFGHAGERVLNRLMKSYGGFEGNAQTVRILADTIYSDGEQRKGMQPSRALLHGVLKYQALWSELPEGDRHNHFLYDSQAELRSFALGDLGSRRSLECQIMDWADDTAYSLNDIVDGVHASFITPLSVERWASTNATNARDHELAEMLIEVLRQERIDAWFGRRTGEYLRAVCLQKTAHFTGESGEGLQLAIEPERVEERRFFGRVARDLVFHAPALQHLEYKSERILTQLFQVFSDRYIAAPPHQSAIDLLPPATAKSLKGTADQAERARLLCDYLSGMTDGFAIRTYRRLFDAEFRSLADF